MNTGKIAIKISESQAAMGNVFQGNDNTVETTLEATQTDSGLLGTEHALKQAINSLRNAIQADTALSQAHNVRRLFLTLQAFLKKSKKHQTSKA
jgi:hypothetical protein